MQYTSRCLSCQQIIAITLKAFESIQTKEKIYIYHKLSSKSNYLLIRMFALQNTVCRKVRNIRLYVQLQKRYKKSSRHRRMQTF